MPTEMIVIDSIVRDLQELPMSKLVDVIHYVHRLNPKNYERRNAALLATAGCMSGKAGEEFECAVKAEADRFDD